ncbi:hypothetical protein IE4771_PE00123 (plasmid) [Rhizobium etli bv. mimosae str. IE4771]|uniref:Uncharacterized protein n=1 Tax=Rhizobium etli bv. mimosae str. IE4771 TaxID=1432050 RepID=A0A060ICG7_RHIET|nr:hypothetical protein IE4771_PE00123 [Rhizobium sp. IE4771]
MNSIRAKLKARWARSQKPHRPSAAALWPPGQTNTPGSKSSPRLNAFPDRCDPLASTDARRSGHNGRQNAAVRDHPKGDSPPTMHMAASEKSNRRMASAKPADQNFIYHFERLIESRWCGLSP